MLDRFIGKIWTTLYNGVGSLFAAISEVLGPISTKVLILLLAMGSVFGQILAFTDYDPSHQKLAALLGTTSNFAADLSIISITATVLFWIGFVIYFAEPSSGDYY